MREGVPFLERDVSRDRAAAVEMVRVSGQTGVPVLVIDGQVVVGFDRGRLETLLAEARRSQSLPKVSLGLRVADARPGPGRPRGAFVGAVKPGSPAEQAGLRTGDVVVEFAGSPILGAADLERAMRGLVPGQEVAITVARSGQLLQLRAVPR